MPGDAYRQMIDQIVSIVTGLATTGMSVFESPAYALAAGKIPALAVVPKDVQVTDVWESSDSDLNLERHRLGVSITTIATTPAQRDQSALEVKEALLNQARPGYARRYARSAFEESKEGERPLFAVSQEFQIDYHVEATVPDVIVT